jgi:hypothetical protein
MLLNQNTQVTLELAGCPLDCIESIDSRIEVHNPDAAVFRFIQHASDLYSLRMQTRLRRESRSFHSRCHDCEAAAPVSRLE